MKLNICDSEDKFDRFFHAFRDRKFPDRPCITDVYDNAEDYWFRYLIDEIHLWFEDNNIDYDLKYHKPNKEDHSCYWIEIHMSPDHLILFKLTWL